MFRRGNPRIERKSFPLSGALSRNATVDMKFRDFSLHVPKCRISRSRAWKMCQGLFSKRSGVLMTDSRTWFPCLFLVANARQIFTSDRARVEKESQRSRNLIAKQDLWWPLELYICGGNIAVSSFRMIKQSPKNLLSCRALADSVWFEGLGKIVGKRVMAAFCSATPVYSAA